VRLADDPARNVVGGASRGGLCAAFVGLRRPDLFGNVLSQSAIFYWRPDDDPEEEWLARQFAAAPRLPLRFYLEAGRYEGGYLPGARPGPLLSGRHLRNVLQAKAYPVTYREFVGGHDYTCWRGTLGDGLLALLGSASASPSTPAGTSLAR
jgi:enterochelin esterase family protein